MNRGSSNSASTATSPDSTRRAGALIEVCAPPAVGVIAVAGFPGLRSAFAASLLGVAEVGAGQLARIVNRGPPP